MPFGARCPRASHRTDNDTFEDRSRSRSLNHPAQRAPHLSSHRDPSHTASYTPPGYTEKLPVGFCDRKDAVADRTEASNRCAQRSDRLAGAHSAVREQPEQHLY